MKRQPISKQRAYQLRQRAKGLCVLCPNPAWRIGADRCEAHRQAFNAWRRNQRAAIDQRAKGE